MIFSLISFLWLQSISQIDVSPNFNHSANWRTSETEHFLVHFEIRNEKSVAHLLKNIESIYSSLTKKFDSTPKDKVHIVVSDNLDISNGLSTPLPYNLVYLFIAPPPDDSSLDSYDDWLKTLVTHELTHTVHLDEARGINKWLRYLFGRIVVPNAIQQQWGLEGLAELEETLLTTKGRGRSPFIQMMIRTSALEKKFLPIEKATYWNPDYPYGGAAYTYGIGFYNFLVNRYGEEKIYDFTKETSSSIVPGFLNFKTDKVFGKSFSRLWNEWQIEEENLWAKAARDFSKYESFMDEDERLEGRPVWDPNSSTLYATVFKKTKGSSLMKYDFKPSSRPKAEVLKSGLSVNSLSYNSEKLYYSKISYVSPTKSYSDIWEFDLKSKNEKRLTRGLRLRDPVVFKDFIYAVRIDDVQSKLVRFNIKDIKDPLTDTSRLEVLYSAQNFDQIAKPAISPSGKNILFTMRDSKSRQIYRLDLDSKSLTKIKSPAYIDAYDPQFISENEVIFSGYHPEELKELKVSLSSSQIFRINLSENTVQMLTHTLTGFNWPALSKNILAAGLYTSTGFKLKFFDTVPAAILSDQVTTERIERAEPVTASLVSRSYESGSTLLPHYLLPYFFYTETDTAIGLLSSSHDPLRTWSWSAAAFHRTGPNRPGGGLTISYHGLDFIDLFVSGSANIYDYGRILAQTNNGIAERILPNHYYERSYSASAGYGARIYSKNGPSPFSFSHSFFYLKRDSLLNLPSGVATGIGDITIPFSTGEETFSQIARGPETGYEAGTSFSLQYSSFIDAQLGLDYSPDLGGSSISQFVTTLSAKKYYELFDDQVIALRLAGGMQWFDPVYQRTFRLGGSFGESPFVSVNKQVYALRGLETSYLRGEGILYGSLEYRIGVLKHIPGFGTAPIWFKNLSVNLFGDSGQTFRWKHRLNLAEAISRNTPEDFSKNRFTVSSGIELQSSISLSYGPPLLFRLGYGKVLLLEGNWTGNESISQTYFSAGASF